MVYWVLVLGLMTGLYVGFEIRSWVWGGYDCWARLLCLYYVIMILFSFRLIFVITLCVIWLFTFGFTCICQHAFVCWFGGLFVLFVMGVWGGWGFVSCVGLYAGVITMLWFTV